MEPSALDPSGAAATADLVEVSYSPFPVVLGDDSIVVTDRLVAGHRDGDATPPQGAPGPASLGPARGPAPNGDG